MHPKKVYTWALKLLHGNTFKAQVDTIWDMDLGVGFRACPKKATLKPKA